MNPVGAIGSAEALANVGHDRFSGVAQLSAAEPRGASAIHR